MIGNSVIDDRKDYKVGEEVKPNVYVSSEGGREINAEHQRLEYNTEAISTVMEDEERVDRTDAVSVLSTAQTYGYESNTSLEDYPLFPTEIISNRNSHLEDSNVIAVVISDTVPAVEEMVVEAAFQQAVSRFYDSEEKYQSSRDCDKVILMSEQRIRSESAEEENNDSVLVSISTNILAKEEEILCRVAFP